MGTKGGRPAGPKTRCSGTWTEARFNSFITSALRQATQRWKPKGDCLKEARISRGIYLCAECKEHVRATTVIEGKKHKNAIVDHIIPVVDPAVGFNGWGEYIERMFCEVKNLQVLCFTCHKGKCNEERAIAKERRKGE